MASVQPDYLKSLAKTTSDFQTATMALEKALGHHAEGDAFAHAKYMRDAVLPVMTVLRTLGDKLETDRRRRSLAASDLSRDAVHQMTNLDSSFAPRRATMNREGYLAWLEC